MVSANRMRDRSIAMSKINRQSTLQTRDYKLGFMEYLVPAGDWAATQTGTLSVGIVVLPDFTLLALANFVEALRLAGDIGDRSEQQWCHWAFMTAANSPVRASCGLEISPTRALADPKAFDYVAVVGGLLHERQEYPREAMGYLTAAAAAGMPLIGVCTGSFALAEAGLMDGYRCCVHGYHEEEFLIRYPQANVETRDIFVVDRDRITCAGGFSAFDMAGFLLERHCGRARATKILHHAVLDKFRNARHPQLPLADPYFRVKDERLRRAVFLMEQHLSVPVSVPWIAGTVGMSERQFSRLFTRQFGVPPARHYRELRLNHGHWLLLNTSRTLTDIASACGFNDSAHFTRCFKDRYGKVPSAVRTKSS